MKELISALLAAVQRGERAVLCTVLASSGSAPRGAGARMAVFRNGNTLGTVGGGAVELRVRQEALETLKSGKAVCRAYSLAPEDVRSVGMICGGAVTVCCQVLTKADEALLKSLLKALEGRENTWLLLCLGADGSVETGLYGAQSGLIFGKEDLLTVVQPHLTARSWYEAGERTLYAEPFSRAGRVWIFGGGHVGRALVPVLASVGFRVSVFDDRPELAVPERYEKAEQVVCGDFADLASAAQLMPDDLAVVMTPGHLADQTVLLQLLRQEPPAYVGCIGSRGKAERTRAFLRENGVPEERIAAVHTPIGLAIGAQTPEEIAVSIAAELIAFRAGRA